MPEDIQADPHGHTIITCRAPFPMRIVIYRGGLPGGDNFIAVSGISGYQGQRCDVGMQRIECGNWQLWPPLYAWNGPATRAWALDIAEQMRPVYLATMNDDIIAQARLHALRIYTPGLAEEISRARTQLESLIARQFQWQMELGGDHARTRP